jgi:hypothetical protein
MATSTQDRRTTGAVLGSAALLGVASGMRSTAGLGVLVLRGGSRPGAAKAAAVIAVGTELVLDKLPVTGSRLEAPGLIGRITFAAIGGALVARASDRGFVPAAVVAAAAALASAKVFHDLRALADRRLPDPAVAVAEDTLAIGVATLAAG